MDDAQTDDRVERVARAIAETWTKRPFDEINSGTQMRMFEYARGAIASLDTQGWRDIESAPSEERINKAADDHATYVGGTPYPYRFTHESLTDFAHAVCAPAPAAAADLPDEFILGLAAEHSNYRDEGHEVFSDRRICEFARAVRTAPVPPATPPVPAQDDKDALIAELVSALEKIERTGTRQKQYWVEATYDHPYMPDSDGHWGSYTEISPESKEATGVLAKVRASKGGAT